MFYHHSVSPVHLYRFEFVWIRLFFISSKPLLRKFCAARSGVVFLTPATNAVYPQRICLFLLGLAPFLLLVLRWFAFGRNANLAGGFAGRRWLVFCLCFWLFSLFVDCCLYTATVLCTFLAFTTSTSVRTEPQATSAIPEKKKSKNGTAWQSHFGTACTA